MNVSKLPNENNRVNLHTIQTSVNIGVIPYFCIANSGETVYGLYILLRVNDRKKMKFWRRTGPTLYDCRPFNQYFYAVSLSHKYTLALIKNFSPC